MDALSDSFYSGVLNGVFVCAGFTVFLWVVSVSRVRIF